MEASPTETRPSEFFLRELPLYLDHLAVEKGLARNSLEAYGRDLTAFGRHLDAEGLSAADKRFAGTLNHLARGIIIGGSLGVIAGWLIPGADMARMVGLGLLCGCLAGVTMKNRADRKEGR